MMTNKKRHLYDKMQFGINKKNAVADTLRAKRAALDAEPAVSVGAKVTGKRKVAAAAAPAAKAVAAAPSKAGKRK